MEPTPAPLRARINGTAAGFLRGTRRAIVLLVLLYIFLFAIALLGAAFKIFGSDFSKALITSTTISYALSRFSFKFNRVIYYIIIAGMMIPIHSAVIPLYIMAMKWKLQNNLFALGAIYAAFRIPVSVFILESFMLTIPKELEECAIIDGCGYGRIFWKIILPLSRDGVVTILILAAIACWNELLVAMLMLSKPMIKTLPIGLMGFITEYEAQYTQLCAGLLIAVLPNLLFYALMQERIVKGMTIGAIKG